MSHALVRTRSSFQAQTFSRAAWLLRSADRCTTSSAFPSTQARWLSNSQRRSDDIREGKSERLPDESAGTQGGQLRAAKQAQVRRPWHRDNVDKPPVDVSNNREGPPLSKGKLLTTPTRLLKLLLPLPVSIEKDRDNNGRNNEKEEKAEDDKVMDDYGRSVSNNDAIQPLALLVHPQQPLSYVERLIQAELPPVMENGKEKIPNVYFRAEDTEGQTEKPSGNTGDAADTKDAGASSVNSKNRPKSWVRWSSSTEMGDFIRDAAKGREFAVEVEGYNVEMRVEVPSFHDRTSYMRARLRKMGRQIDELATIKRECDQIAHRSANRLAKGGFALMTVWWGVVYYVTFQTDFGWDLVEPITYLVGLTTIMAGYLWFLYISRDLSYKAALQITVSRRQNVLYEARGFNVQRWEQLVQEANTLRSEIRAIAVEYDVEWDESKDVGEQVRKTLDHEKRKSGNRSDEDDSEDRHDEQEQTEARQKEEHNKRG